jgi:hypothetical protein
MQSRALDELSRYESVVDRITFVQPGLAAESPESPEPSAAKLAS